MIQMILSEEQQQLLSNAKEPVSIFDRGGRLLTRVQSGWTDGEIAEALLKANESGLSPESFSETVARLKQDYPIPATAYVPH